MKRIITAILAIAICSPALAQPNDYMREDSAMFSDSDTSAESWESGSLGSFWVTEHVPGDFRLYYSAASDEQAEDFHIGVATSTDGRTWIRDTANNPLISPTSGWRGVGVLEPCVIVNSPTDWRMWFSGQDSAGRRQIGYATSSDGIAWSASECPVLLAGNGFDRVWAKNPVVVLIGNTYHLYYTGYDGSKIRVGHAVSSDGVQWSKANASDVTGELGHPTADLYYPFVRSSSPLEMLVAKSGGGGYDIFRYTSDGTVWTEAGLFWSRGPTGNPDDLNASRCQIHDDKLYYKCRSAGETTAHRYMMAEESPPPPPPTGTLSESFAGTGSLGPDQVWNGQDWKRVNGVAERSSNSDTMLDRVAVIHTPIASNDHWAEVEVSSLSGSGNTGHAGIVLSSSIDGANCFLMFVSTSGTANVGTMVNGSWVGHLGTAISIPLSYPLTLRGEIIDVGSDVQLTMKINGVIVRQETTPKLSTNSHVGIYGRSRINAKPRISSLTAGNE